MAEEVERGPLGGQQAARPARRQGDVGGDGIAPLALDDQVVDGPTPHCRIVSATASRPKTTPGCFCTILARAAPRRGPSPRWSCRPPRRPRQAPVQRRGESSRRPRSRAGALIRDVRISRRGRRPRLIGEVTDCPPFQSTARRARRGRDGDPARRGRPQRRRGLLPGDLPGRPARLPELATTRNLRGWLLTIAHRKAIDHHRANGRRPLPVAEPDEFAARPRARADEGIWDAGRGAAAETAGGGRPALRLRPPPRRDRRRARLLARGARRSLHEGIKRLRKELA